MLFKINDIVIYTSNRWGDQENNPLWNGKYGKIVGTVLSVLSGDMDYEVKWDNGCINSYNQNDLLKIPTILEDMKDLFEI